MRPWVRDKKVKALAWVLDFFVPHPARPAAELSH
jgi:hypothetical protein